MKFSPEKRERLLDLVEEGASIAAAAAEVGISPQTVSTWRTKGRAGQPVYKEFAERLDSIGDGPPLTEEDLIELLEQAARRGSLRAIQLLLTRPWERPPSRDDEAAAERRHRENVRRAFGLKPADETTNQRRGDA